MKPAVKTKIKICGIKRTEDVSILNRYLPDYAGFVFAESRRQISVNRALELAKVMDRRIKKAGIFVNEAPSVVAEAALACELDVIQLHGDETQKYVAELEEVISSYKDTELFSPEIWKAVRVRNDSSITLMDGFKVKAFVLDAYSNTSYGGEGKIFDWNLADKVKEKFRIILAGGLTPQNVCYAIRKVNPFAVDISSGVETDGFKDEVKIKDFISNARGRI